METMGMGGGESSRENGWTQASHGLQLTMNKGMTKRESLERLDQAFLRTLASELNGDYFGAYREYSEYSRDRMLDILSNRLNVDEVQFVVSRYLLCHDAGAIARSIKPDEARDIKRAVEHHFGKDGVYEVKIGNRFCDLVFPDMLVAVEIKSARDKVERAVDQTHDYARWADEVFLAYDIANEHLIPDELSENEVGLLRYEDQFIDVIKQAKPEKPSKNDLLLSMTSENLRNLAKEHDVSTVGKKKRVADRLASNLSETEVREIFSEYLRSRGLSEIGH